MKILVRRIKYGSNEYDDEVNLRVKILRDPLGLTFTDEQLREEKDEFHIAAFLDGKLVGCLLLKPVNKTVIQMRQVAVDVDLQKLGIGKQLVAFAEKFILAKGFTKITLHAREVVVPFYKKSGYICEGDIFIEVTIPHQTMVKNLRQ